MSAYIQGKAHFDAIIATTIDIGGRQDDASWYEADGVGRTYVLPQTANFVGQVLLDENIKSVQYRYDGEPVATLPGPVDLSETYVYEPGRILTIPELFMALDGLEYQSCEHPEWETSQAHRIVQAIRNHAWSHLPGYEAADTWSI